MKKLIAILVFLSSNLSLASSPGPEWGRWRLDAHSVGCDLSKDYYVPHTSQPNHRGIFVGTVFGRASFRFSAKTFTHGNIITSDELGVIRFALQIEPIESQIRDEEKISKAIIGDYEVQARIQSIHPTHIFWLPEQESLSLLQRFANNEIVDFSLVFASGATKSFKIYPSGGTQHNNHVWIAMFKTCIKEHVRR